MEIERTLIIVILSLLTFFLLIIISATLIFVQILTSIKRIIDKSETFIDNLEKNQEEIKIKILDFIENVLNKAKRLLTEKYYAPKGKGGESNDKKEKKEK